MLERSLKVYVPDDGVLGWTGCSTGLVTLVGAIAT